MGAGSAGPTRHPSEEMDVESIRNQPSGVGSVGSGYGYGDGGKDGKEGKDHDHG